MDTKQSNMHSESKVSIEFIHHIDHWLEYLTALLDNADRTTKPKLERQIKCLLEFRAGTNCNINHNLLLLYYYTNRANDESGNIHLHTKQVDAQDKKSSNHQPKVDSFITELKDRICSASMSIYPTEPIQNTYHSSDPAFQVILKSLASEDLFFMQGPPGTGKTTAIVEIILQVLKAKPNARILISSETHVAVDNAIDRLALEASSTLMDSILRYPKFSISEFECDKTEQAEALLRAEGIWQKAYNVNPELTLLLWSDLAASNKNDDDTISMARWQARNLAEMHQIIGVTCNQIGHLMDSETEMFDLAIVDECSKATMPEWLMAMSVAKKCILVGDHKQLPPTFCTEESEVLEQMEDHKEQLIRNGVIERLFENLPSEMKGTLEKQFRMLPNIGEFISHHFYSGQLKHHRTKTDHNFQDFGWFTYKSPKGYRVPAQQGNDKKILVNKIEIKIIIDQLTNIYNSLNKNETVKKLSVAVITPYRAQRKELRQAIKKHDFSKALAIEVDTVDAFQGRQADIVFFSFVRNIGPATFYADDRRMNVAISRARDAVYLIGDIEYISSKRLPVLKALSNLPILFNYQSSNQLLKQV